MNSFFYEIVNVISSFEAVFVSTVFVTVATFAVTIQLLNHWRVKKYIVAGILCGLINGAAALSVNVLLENFYALVPLLAAPVMLIVELLILTKEKNKISYFIVFFCIAVNYVAFYDVLTSGLHLLHYQEAGLFEVGGYTYRNLLFSGTNIITGIVFIGIRAIKRFPREELNYMIHNVRQGFMLFMYIIPATIILIITNVIFSPASNTIQIGEFEYILYINMILKTFLILFGGYLIIFIHAYQHKLEEKSNSLAQSLANEVAYRKNTQRDMILYYRINMTKRIIDDSVGFFENLDDINDEDFKTLGKFLADVCHPQDRDNLLKTNIEKMVDDAMQDEGSTISTRFRLSLDTFLSVIDLKTKNEGCYKNLSAYKKEYIWTLISLHISMEEDTKDVICHVTLVDIDEQVNAENVLIEAAYKDQLTGLYNRKGSIEQIQEKLKQHAQGALFLLDLDKFKAINDTFGHPEGDRLLVLMANRINFFFRGDDVISRLGGDEFMIFTDGLCDIEIIKARAQSLNTMLMETYTNDEEKEIRVTASIGIAIAPKHGTQFEQLYEFADKALYRAKEDGRNTFKIFDDEMLSNE